MAETLMSAEVDAMTQRCRAGGRVVNAVTVKLTNQIEDWGAKTSSQTL